MSAGGLATKSKWVTGNQHMTRSAVYPIEFCHMILSTHDMWMRNLKHEWWTILQLAVWPLLRKFMHLWGSAGIELYGEIGLMFFTMLMV